MPHLNELQEKFGGRGLTVVGVTGEGARMTEPWVAEHEAKYAYGYDSKGALGRWFGVRGIPDAILIDANGTIVWRGPPMLLDEKTVESALEGAIERPLWEWPDSARKVKKALVSGKYAAALEAAGELEGDYEAIVKRRIAHKAGAVEKAIAAGDFLLAKTLGEPAAKELAGLPEGAQVAGALADIKKDKHAKSVLKAQIELADLVSEGRTSSSRKKVERAVDAIEKLRDDHPGTIVERHANAALEELRERLGE